MSTPTKNYHIVFWNSGQVFQAPATSNQKLTLTGVVSAVLNWNFSPQNGSGFDNICFNSTCISTKSSGSADVTMYVIANGTNQVALNYREGVSAIVTNNWLDSGIATVTLDVVATSAGQQAPTTTYSLSSLPWWVYLVIALIGAVILYLVLRKLGIIGDVGKAVNAAVKLAPLVAL